MPRQGSMHAQVILPAVAPKFAKAQHALPNLSMAMRRYANSSAFAVTGSAINVRFSNRPFEVKHFQTIHHCSVDVAHGLALLFGIGTRALPLWDSRTRRNNLSGGLTVSVTAGPSGHTNSPHPSSREGHHSTARWSSSFLLS